MVKVLLLNKTEDRVVILVLMGKLTLQLMMDLQRVDLQQMMEVLTGTEDQTTKSKVLMEMMDDQKVKMVDDQILERKTFQDLNLMTIQGVDLKENVDNMMTQLEKVRLKLGNDFVDIADDVITMELEMAADMINDIRNYIPTAPGDVEPQYRTTQVLMTVEAITKYGAEGEYSHSDNGVTRMYDNASSYSNATLRKIIPKVRSI